MGIELQKYRAAGLGEILWDLLPSGKVLGGAPANFAYHLNSLGIPSYPISSIGNDVLGDEIVTSLKSNLLSTEYIQISSEFKTGTVAVQLDNEGKPAYNIMEDVAWDNIILTGELVELAGSCNAVCFGSLAQRLERSRETILEFLQKTQNHCIKVFDINLRQKYYSDKIINESLSAATVLKLNEDELSVIANIFGYSGSEESILNNIINNYKLDLIAFTMGANGSQLLKSNSKSFLSPEIADIVDTVGAGDAFTAGLVYGLLNDIELEHTHKIANKLALFVCSHSGATPAISIAEKRRIINS